MAHKKSAGHRHAGGNCVVKSSPIPPGLLNSRSLVLSKLVRIPKLRKLIFCTHLGPALGLLRGQQWDDPIRLPLRRGLASTAFHQLRGAGWCQVAESDLLACANLIISGRCVGIDSALRFAVKERRQDCRPPSIHTRDHAAVDGSRTERGLRDLLGRYRPVEDCRHVGLTLRQRPGTYDERRWRPGTGGGWGGWSRPGPAATGVAIGRP
jgi:hypothetical protein